MGISESFQIPGLILSPVLQLQTWTLLFHWKNCRPGNYSISDQRKNYTHFLICFWLKADAMEETAGMSEHAKLGKELPGGQSGCFSLYSHCDSFALLPTCLPLELAKTRMAEHTCKGFFSIKSFEVGRFLIWIFEAGRYIFNLSHTFCWQPI